jgi:para-nitrobenzyl esterase
MALYPTGRRRKTRGDAVSAAIGDVVVCRTRTTAQWHSEIHPETYLYHFTFSPGWSNLFGFRAFHGLETMYVFGNPPPRPRFLQFDATEARVSQTMIQIWVNFARSGNPNGHGICNWPRYSVVEDGHMFIDACLRPGQYLRRPQCDFRLKLCN